MKMAGRTIRAFTLFFPFLFLPALQAADVTFFVGGLKPGTIQYKDADVALDGSPVYGVRLATYIVPNFGMEHSFAFSSDYLFPRNIEEVKDAKGFSYSGNLIFNVPVNRVVPYLTVGVGLIHQYGDSDLPVGTDFAFNYGGGLKFPRIFGPLGLRFDMRGYRVGAVSNTLHMLEVSGGMMISFGK